MSQCAGSKVKKTEKPSQKVSKRTSDSEKTESEEDEEFDSKDVDRMFKGIKKPTLTVFSGDKDLYHDWKAQFEIVVDQMKVPAKTKMMMLKNSLSGKPLQIVERLGYTPREKIKLPWRNLTRNMEEKSDCCNDISRPYYGLHRPKKLI